MRPDRPFNSWDALKLLGIAFMFADHAGLYLYPDYFWLRGLGRGAAPIFFFLVGFAPSHRFSWELAVLAALMSLSNLLLTGHPQVQNMLVTILVYRGIFHWLERRRIVIHQPYQWFFGCLSLIGTTLLMQYGSIGFWFALCGYFKRNPHACPARAQRNFWLLSFLTYGLATGLILHLGWLDFGVMGLTLAAVFYLLWRFDIRPVGNDRALARAAAFTARHSAYIYAFHLIALSWWTAIPL